MITFAGPSDIQDILAFIKELAEFEKLSHEVTATEDSLRSTLFGPKAFAEVLWASLDGQRAGMAIFYHSYSTFLGRPSLYLEDLYVRPAFRGRGIGRDVLKFLAQLALDRGCGRLEWSVLDWNKKAIDLYVSLGAKPLSDWTVYRVSGPDLKNLAAKGEI